MEGIAPASVERRLCGLWTWASAEGGEIRRLRVSDESRDQFRGRLGECVRAAGARFLFVDEIDARL
jgi:hypothetical protein